MSTPVDPLVTVMRYFETANLDAARTALTVAKEIIRKRSPQPAKKGKKSAGLSQEFAPKPAKLAIPTAEQG